MPLVPEDGDVDEDILEDGDAGEDIPEEEDADEEDGDLEEDELEPEGEVAGIAKQADEKSWVKYIKNLLPS